MENRTGRWCGDANTRSDFSLTTYGCSWLDADSTNGRSHSGDALSHPLRRLIHMAAVLSPRSHFLDTDLLDADLLDAAVHPELAATGSAPWNEPSGRPVRPQLRLVQGGR